MSTFYKPRRGRRPSSTDWLQILDVDGPFLAAPVVTDTWPDGLPALAQKQMDALRAASTLYDANPGIRDAFITHVLSGLLDWRSNLVTGPDAATYAVHVPEHHQTVDIGFAVRGQDADGTGTSAPLLLGMILPPKTPTTGRAPAGSGTWTAGPADRLAHAMRARKVSLGLVTNGETWTLVTLSKKDGRDETSALSTATWTRHAWLEEQQTLRAFAALLTRTRFFGVPDDESLPGLLAQSLNRQEEVTERLAEQSQAVVEMLVASIGRLDAHHQSEQGTRLLPSDVGPAQVYQAAVTVLMRLVFLLYAEERGLLPLDDDTYASAYAVNTLADSLRDRATDHGEDALERTATGWYRLLALFRGVHRGARHEQLILPAYGGSLFDPDRFPWLEGRPAADAPLGSGDVPAIDDRTLLKALDSLQTLQFAKERRQVSYRSLDVEQIGYVYEGLLDQDALTATDWVVSISVSDKDLRKNGPELLLSDLEAKRAISEDTLATWLVEQIKAMKGNRSKASILKALTPLEGDDKPRYERLVREACGNDDATTARVLPYGKLLRLDPRDLPVVYPPGSLYLTDSTARANTGAVYTPRFLAEQVVETTLEAIVYSPGPLDTEDKSAWVLKTPEQILDLKVCDIAAGSGAFLVAATRYLADRLLDSRRHYAATGTARAVAAAGAAVQTSPPASADSSDVAFGETEPASLGLRELAKAEEDQLDARRDVISHCIYGVDINPMAIEMAKLSLWLTSLDRNRPFNFLDDHLAVGDSLLGITNPQQLIDLHFDPKKGRALRRDTLDLFTSTVERDLKVAAELRAQITQTGDRDSRDAETKQRLLRRAREVTARVALVADGLTAASLAGGKDSDHLALAALVSAASTGDDPDDQALRAWIEARLVREEGDGWHLPAHYPLVFPEVFSEGHCGFDAVVGNPPFLGGGKISGVLGAGYRKFLGLVVADGRKAKRPDLAAFFVLRARVVLAATGAMGLVATDTISQGDTREMGLDILMAEDWRIFSADKSAPWPSASASIYYSRFSACAPGRSYTSTPVLAGERVFSISSSLELAGYAWTPRRLATGVPVAYMGSVLHGAGFILSPDEASALIGRDSRNRNVVRPLLSGSDVAQEVGASPSRFVIDFGRMSRQQAESYPDVWQVVLQRVLPDRLQLNPKTYGRIREKFWEYWAPRQRLYSDIAGLERVIVLPLVSKYAAPTFSRCDVVFQHKVGVVVSDDIGLLGLLCSSVHQAWTQARSATMGTTIAYSLTDTLETLVLPPMTEELRVASDNFVRQRDQYMAVHGLGLTSFYNRFHAASEQHPSLVVIRSSFGDLDRAVWRAYGWNDDALAHAFVSTVAGGRWSVGLEAQSALVDALTRLNEVRHEFSVGSTGASGGKSAAKLKDGAQAEPMLFGDDT